VSVPRALLLMLALLQATGLAEAMQRQICEAECRDNGCDDDCVPGNDSPSCPCHCPSLTTRVPAAVVAVAIPPATQAAPAIDSDDRLHLSPDPREILHVPRHNV
jgi:hypothetical protein